MRYKAVKRIPNGKNNMTVKDSPILKAKGFNDIRFTTMFLDGEWLKRGPRRVINICTEANEYLWPIRGRIYYNRNLESFIWDDLTVMRRYPIKADGSLDKGF